METSTLHVKDLLILATATIAAAASIISIFVNIRLSKQKERSNKIWEKELERFFELEEQVGILVENLIVFRCREESEKHSYFEKQQYLASAIGRFRRYPVVLHALRQLQNDAGWYFRQDMKHETKEDYEEARNNLESSYNEFLAACDTVLDRK